MGVLVVGEGEGLMMMVDVDEMKMVNVSNF